MSNQLSAQVWSSLLLAAATVIGGGLATPASAQRVEVFVNGQRVTDVVINGRVSNGTNGRVNGVHGDFAGADYIDGADGFVDGAADEYGDATDADVYINGADGAPHTNGNGAQYGFVDGANGGEHCSDGYRGRHSAPHRSLPRGTDRAPIF
jgi:hypothetical protein